MVPQTVITNPNEYHMLYRFALDCAEKKIKNTCGFMCQQCASNISIYGLSQRDAVMIQHSAEMEMNHRLEIQSKHRIRRAREKEASRAGSMELGTVMLIYFLVVALIVSITLGVMFGGRSGRVVRSEPQQNIGSFDLQYAIESIKWYKDRGIDIAFWDTGTFKNNHQFNCVDWAVGMYDLATQAGVNARLIRNRSIGGIDHLFVRLNGTYIEPQTGKTMLQEWGRAYNEALNEDVTSTFINLSYDIDALRRSGSL
jgi:hypothetical protein